MVLNVALIGLGYWGKHYVRLTSNNTRVNLVSICDLNKEALEKYNHLKITTYSDYNKMLQNEKIDAVIIVTVASSHYKIIKDIISYNKEIFVEKPYTLSYDYCNDINNRLSKKIMVGHTYLFNSKVNYIKNFILDNKIDVKTVNFEWCCYGPIREDTTPIFDLSVHPLSILLYLFPSLEITNIVSLKSKTNNTYFCNLLIGDILVNMNISWSSPGKTRQMTINSDEIKIVFDDVSNINPVKIYYINDPNYNNNIPNIIHTDGNIIIPQIENTEPLTNQFNHWLDTIINKDNCITDNIFGTKIVKIAQEMENTLN
jgi:UDP-N-acetylglucosamine 3-dehydrogenase